ncbi:MAG: carboxypeptidase-like regulatory domain-containing protein [Methanoregula sp.]|nr:carboxypeptidase-like regulatory domain-containing protein [Methanoregula sp.]
MYRYRIRFLLSLLCIIIFCSAVQATILQINVQDSLDNSSISHATVFLDGADLGRTNNNGQFVISHSGLNDLNIIVSQTGYDDWSKIVIKNETSVIAYMNRKSLTLNVKLFDSDTIQPVYGATINLSAENFTQTKQSDITGSATFGVQATTLYSIYITASNYQPRSGMIDVETENKDVQYWLISGNRFSFAVKDKDGMVPVPDAEIRVDSVLMGKTDANGILITPIARGKYYTLQIKKDGYETFSVSRMISDTDALFETILTKSPVGAFIYVSDVSKSPLSGADIRMNGTIVATTNQYGRANLPDLISGTYTIDVQKAGYGTTTTQINITKSGNDFTVELPFESAPLTIYIQDKDQKIIPNANILLNGAVAGTSDTHGQFTTTLNYNTPYNITATRDGYYPGVVQKQFPLGTTPSPLTITLEKTTDWSLVTLIGVGVIIVLCLFAVIRIFSRRKRRHIIKKNEL